MTEKFWGIIPSGGRGSRSGASIPKQYVEIAGRTILQHAIDALQSHPDCAGIAVAADPLWHARISEMVADVNVPTILVEGGARRQDSVLSGLNALPGGDGIVLVHDAARPCLSREVIDRVLEGLQTAELALPGLSVIDTLKRVDEDGLVVETVRRESYRTVQTPQGARRSTLQRAFIAARRNGVSVTDEAGLVELTGGRVRVVEGDPRNLKVTRPGDFRVAEDILLGIL